MAMIQINKDPSRRQLAVFGLTWLVFFSIVGWTVWHRAEALTIAATLWAGAVLVPAIGWVAPRFLRVVYLAVSYATFPIGCAVSFLTLAGVYYMVLTPIGLVLRLFRDDPMGRRFDGRARTYWAEHPQKDNPQSYLKQF